MTEEKLSEEEAIFEISKIMKNVDDKEAWARILTWASGKFIGRNSLPAELPPVDGRRGAVGSGPSRSNRISKGRKKVLLSIDKMLNLRPSGTDSLEKFVEEKAPSSNLARNVVCIYYLKKHLKVDNVTANQVYTCYKTLGWRVPADLINTLQQAASQGWLDTSDGENILVTTHGENLVEYDLPKQ